MLDNTTLILILVAVVLGYLCFLNKKEDFSVSSAIKTSHAFVTPARARELMVQRYCNCPRCRKPSYNYLGVGEKPCEKDQIPYIPIGADDIGVPLTEW